MKGISADDYDALIPELSDRINYCTALARRDDQARSDKLCASSPRNSYDKTNCLAMGAALRLFDAPTEEQLEEWGGLDRPPEPFDTPPDDLDDGVITRSDAFDLDADGEVITRSDEILSFDDSLGEFEDLKLSVGDQKKLGTAKQEIKAATERAVEAVENETALLADAVKSDEFQAILSEKYTKSKVLAVLKAPATLDFWAGLIPGKGIFDGIGKSVDARSRKGAHKWMMLLMAGQESPSPIAMSVMSSLYGHQKGKEWAGNISAGIAGVGLAVGAVGVDGGVGSLLAKPLGTAIGAAVADVAVTEIVSTAAETVVEHAVDSGVEELGIQMMSAFHLPDSAERAIDEELRKRIPGDAEARKRAAGPLKKYMQGRALLEYLGPAERDDDELDEAGVSREEEDSRVELKASFGSPPEQDLTANTRKARPMKGEPEVCTGMSLEELYFWRYAVAAPLGDKQSLRVMEQWADRALPVPTMLQLLWQTEKIWEGMCD